MPRSEIPFIVQEADGDVIAGASCLITVRSGGANATIYSAETGTGTLSNPVFTTSTGRIPGWLETGSYNVTVSGTGITTYTRALEITRGDSIAVPDGSISTAKIADNAVTTAKIGNDQVTTTKIADNAVTTLKIADSQVTQAKIEPATVTALQATSDLSITTAKLANSAVTTAKLADDSVTAAKIPNDAIGSTEIAGGAVGTSEIADDAVTSVKISTDGVLLRHLSDTAMPVGAIIMFAGATAPAGWNICNGAAISRTTYGELYTRIGTTYGAGNGSTTFNLPDLQGRIPVGVGTHGDVNALSKNDGAALANRRPGHSHTVHPHTHGLANHGHSIGTPHNGYDTVAYKLDGAVRTARSDHIHYTGGPSNNTSDSTTPGTYDSTPAFLVVNFIIRVE